jgi:hypothetical protein
VNIQIAKGLTPQMNLMIGRLVAALGTGIEALPGTLVIGVDDPTVPTADVQRPLAVMPAHGPGRTTPWGAALIAAADTVVLFDTSEVHAYADALADRSVVVAGLPRPEPTATGWGLDVDGAPEEIRRAWLRESPIQDQPGAGVAWVWGRGVAPLAAALDGWRAGRAVVALPQTDDHDLLRRGQALRAHSVAEAVEATRFLLENPPLAQALGARGRTVAAQMPSARQVALRVLEGIELARQSAMAVSR